MALAAPVPRRILSEGCGPVAGAGGCGSRGCASAAGTARLVCISAAVAGHEVPASGIVIGRQDDCAIRLQGPTVSGRHCRICRGEEGGFELEDLSSNGTFVNRLKVGKGNVVKLRDGDLVQIANRRVDEMQFTFVQLPPCVAVPSVASKRQLHSPTSGSRAATDAAIGAEGIVDLEAEDEVESVDSAAALRPRGAASDLTSGAPPLEPRHQPQLLVPPMPSAGSAALTAVPPARPASEACDVVHEAAFASVGRADASEADAVGVLRAPVAVVRAPAVLPSPLPQAGAATAPSVSSAGSGHPSAARSAAAEATLEAERAELWYQRQFLTRELAELEAGRDIGEREIAAAEAALLRERARRERLAHERDQHMFSCARLAGDIEALRIHISEINESARGYEDALLNASGVSASLEERLARARRDALAAAAEQRRWEEYASGRETRYATLREVARTFAGDLRTHAGELARQLATPSAETRDAGPDFVAPTVPHAGAASAPTAGAALHTTAPSPRRFSQDAALPACEESRDEAAAPAAGTAPVAPAKGNALSASPADVVLIASCGSPARRRSQGSGGSGPTGESVRRRQRRLLRHRPSPAGARGDAVGALGAVEELAGFPAPKRRRPCSVEVSTGGVEEPPPGPG